MKALFRIKDNSIENQLKLINLVTVTILMGLLCVGMIFNEFSSYKKSLLESLSIQASIIGSNSTAALSFLDSKAAKETLLSLSSAPGVVYAVIYKDGSVFASYRRDKKESVPQVNPVGENGTRFSLRGIDLSRAISHKGEKLGVLLIRSDLDKMYRHLILYTGMIFTIALASLFSAFLLFSRFQKVITTPIHQLAGLFKTLSEKRDYSLRAKVEGAAEFLTLASGFNNMLEQIQNRENQLEQSHQNLSLTNQELREKEERLRKVFDEGPLGMVLIDLHYRFIKVNESLARLLGKSETEFVDKEITEIFHPDDVTLFQKDIDRLYSGAIQKSATELRLRRPDEDPVWINFIASMIRDEQGIALYCIGMLENITERRSLHERLMYDARHDALTQLPNRYLLVERLNQLINHTARDRSFHYALLFLDLDRFKNINDSFGHLAGDQLLVEVSTRLNHCVRAYNTIARFGGDEFAILLEDTRSEMDAPYVAENILKAFQTPFNIDGNDILMTVSIGIVLGFPEYQSTEQVLRDADIAMYQAKSRDRNCFIIFNEEMHARVKASLKLENELRQGIQNKELVLYYQPIVSVATLEVTGFESLVRWKGPDGRLIQPLEFIPVAEETGLIVPLGKWCFTEACHQLARWNKMFPLENPFSISVNLSGKQIRAGLIDFIREVITETDLRPGALAVELTESVIMENTEIANELISELTELKVRIYLDDFGTGYSSLSYLHRIRIDAMKIDRSFVMAMTSDDRARGIVKTIINLAHSLNKIVIAEGVETSEQLDELKKMGCKYFQGYLYSRPLPGREIEALLKDPVFQPKLKSRKR